jgi:hypothetical protein
MLLLQRLLLKLFERSVSLCLRFIYILVSLFLLYSLFRLNYRYMYHCTPAARDTESHVGGGSGGVAGGGDGFGDIVDISGGDSVDDGGFDEQLGLVVLFSLIVLFLFFVFLLLC